MLYDLEIHRMLKVLFKNSPLSFRKNLPNEPVTNKELRLMSELLYESNTVVEIFFDHQTFLFQFPVFLK